MHKGLYFPSFSPSKREVLHVEESPITAYASFQEKQRNLQLHENTSLIYLPTQRLLLQEGPNGHRDLLASWSFLGGGMWNGSKDTIPSFIHEANPVPSTNFQFRKAGGGERLAPKVLSLWAQHRPIRYYLCVFISQLHRKQLKKNGQNEVGRGEHYFLLSQHIAANIV